MTLAVSLSPEAQRRLSSRAESEGLDLPTFAARVLEAEAQRLPPTQELSGTNKKTLDLLAQWDREEDTSDPAEIARAQREVEEFMEGINHSRLGSEGPNSRKIFP